MTYHAVEPSGSDDAQQGPRPVHGERRNWPGRASPSPMTSSANGSDSLVSFAISENLMRVPMWDSSGNIANRSFLLYGLAYGPKTIDNIPTESRHHKAV